MAVRKTTLVKLLTVCISLLYLISCSSVNTLIDTDEHIFWNYNQRLVLGAALEKVGTRYKAAATGPNGFDCSGLMYYSFSKANIKMARTSASQATMGYSVDVSEAIPGDLLVFADKGRVNHVGVVYQARGGQLKMIHSSSSKGVVIEEVLQSGYWRSRLVDVRRILD